MRYSLLLLIFITALFSCVSQTPKTPKEPKTKLDLKEIKTEDDIRTFLSISDIHLDIDADTIEKTKWGWSDTNKKLWEMTKKKLNELVDQKDSLKIDFMVFTGDIPFHSMDNTKRIKNIEVVLTYLSELSKNSNLPLLFVPGNNDGLAGDYASFRDSEDQSPFVKDSINGNKWPFIGNKGKCGEDVTGSCYIDSSSVYGYYSAYPLANKKMRFIGLNTVINNSRTHSLCYNPPADGERQAIAAKIQMDWFLAQMEAADAADEKVLIAMHIPPGINGYDGHSFWANFATSTGQTIGNTFIQSITKHQDKVVGVLAGHTHMDEFKMILDTNSKMVGLCLFTPGITPQHGNNPGFKLYSYHTNTFELMDFTTIWSDFFNKKTVQPFDYSYSFKEIYQSKENLSIKEHINSLFNKNNLDFIQQGMEKTFKVMSPHTLSTTEKAAIEMRVDTTAIAIEASECK